MNGKGSNRRKYNKENEKQFRENAFFKTCEYEKKKQNKQ